MNQKRKKVSVIIPCYNSANSIIRSVKSALEQTYKDIEIIIVDDCSTDNLLETLSPFQESIKIISHKINRGVSQARNTGAIVADGEILAFLDADDWWPKDFIENQISLLTPNTAIMYDCEIVEELGEERKKYSYENTLDPWFKGKGPVLLNKENMYLVFYLPNLFKGLVYKEDHLKIDGFDTRFFLAEDFHYLVKLLAFGITVQINRSSKGYYSINSTSFLNSVFSEEKRNKSRSQMYDLYNSMCHDLQLPQRSLNICKNIRNYYRFTNELYRFKAKKQDFNFSKFILSLPSALFVKILKIK